MGHITGQYIAGSATASSLTQPGAGSAVDTSALKLFGNKVIQQLNTLRAEALRHEEELTMLGKKHDILESSTLPKYIISDRYQKWHVRLVYVDVAIGNMKTRCGWRCGASIFERRAFAPIKWKPDERCPRCFDLAEDRKDIE